MCGVSGSNMTHSKFLDLYFKGDMGQSIQEWTKLNLWKTAFKIFEGIMSSTNFTWSILDYLDLCISNTIMPKEKYQRNHWHEFLNFTIFLQFRLKETSHMSCLTSC